METEQKDKIDGQKQLKTILELTSTEARKYFMESKTTVLWICLSTWTSNLCWITWKKQ